MFRIDNANATSTLPTPLAPGPVTKGYFQSGNPAIGQKATTVDRDWANTQQEEIANVVEAAGITLSKTDNTQLLQALRSLFVTRTKVTANMTIYVNPTSGSDANNGLTPGAAFATIQAAIWTVYYSYDWNGYSCTIQLANGTYTTSVANGYAAYFNSTPFGMPWSTLTLRGNEASPGNVIINTINSNCLGVQFTYLAVRGVTFQASGTVNGPVVYSGYGVISGFSSVIDLANCAFRSCGVAQVSASNGGVITISPPGNVSFTGTTQAALNINVGGQIWLPATTITVTSLTVSAGFAQASECGTINCQSAIFAGTATGPRFTVFANGVINTGGGGANFFPGSTAGVQVTGGQYI